MFSKFAVTIILSGICTIILYMYLLKDGYQFHANTPKEGNIGNINFTHEAEKEIVINPRQKDQHFTFLIENRDICKKVPALKYIVYVYSTAQRFKRREVLRSTWLNTALLQSRGVARVFLLGRQDGKNSQAIQSNIIAENEIYGDIVQGDFHESYRNLSLKGLMGMKWLSTYCRNAGLVIKIDDDVAVNFVNLLSHLAKYEDEKNSFVCRIRRDAEILRDESTCGKWCVPWQELPMRRYYPDYCSGGIYVMTSDMPPLLYKAVHSAEFVSMEDAYITGVLRETIGDVTLHQSYTSWSHSKKEYQIISSWLKSWKNMLNNANRFLE